MRAIRSKLNYANVVATIAMFLALGGGAAFAASKIKTGDIAKNAIKKNQLAKNSVTKDDFAKGSLIVSTATGGPVAANVPATAPATGVPLPLKGKATFTPKKGKVGLLLAEAKGSLASAAPPAGCTVFIDILVNGDVATTLFLNDTPGTTTADSTGAAREDVSSSSTPIGLTGGPQVITAQYDGDPDCVPAAAVSQLKVEVAQLR